MSKNETKNRCVATTERLVDLNFVWNMWWKSFTVKYDFDDVMKINLVTWLIIQEYEDDEMNIDVEISKNFDEDEKMKIAKDFDVKINLVTWLIKQEYENDEMSIDVEIAEDFDEEIKIAKNFDVKINLVTWLIKQKYENDEMNIDVKVAENFDEKTKTAKGFDVNINLVTWLIRQEVREKICVMSVIIFHDEKIAEDFDEEIKIKVEVFDLFAWWSRMCWCSFVLLAKLTKQRRHSNATIERKTFSICCWCCCCWMTCCCCTTCCCWCCCCCFACNASLNWTNQEQLRKNFRWSSYSRWNDIDSIMSNMLKKQRQKDENHDKMKFVLMIMLIWCFTKLNAASS